MIALTISPFSILEPNAEHVFLVLKHKRKIVSAILFPSICQETQIWFSPRVEKFYLPKYFFFRIFLRNFVRNFFPPKIDALKKVLTILVIWHVLRGYKYVSNSFRIKWNMNAVTVFLVIMNQTDYRLVYNQKENCHDDHISWVRKDFLKFSSLFKKFVFILIFFLLFNKLITNRFNKLKYWNVSIYWVQISG